MEKKKNNSLFDTFSVKEIGTVKTSNKNRFHDMLIFYMSNVQASQTKTGTQHITEAVTHTDSISKRITLAKEIIKRTKQKVVLYIRNGH